LSQHWIDPNVTDSNGDTPLHICAERDFPSCVRILLEYGAIPDVKNKKGKTAIHVSVESHSIDVKPSPPHPPRLGLTIFKVLREIVENSISDKSIMDEGGNTPLHYAVQMRYI
jgi:ankyrin repeat protein